MLLRVSEPGNIDHTYFQAFGKKRYSRVFKMNYNRPHRVRPERQLLYPTIKNRLDYIVDNLDDLTTLTTVLSTNARILRNDVARHRSVFGNHLVRTNINPRAGAGNLLANVATNPYANPEQFAQVQRPNLPIIASVESQAPFFQPLPGLHPAPRPGPPPTQPATTSEDFLLNWWRTDSRSDSNTRRRE